MLYFDGNIDIVSNENNLTYNNIITMPEEKMHWIKLVYIYLFSVIGLVLVVIGSVRLLDMGLKATVFKKAEYSYDARPAPPFVPVASKEESIASSVIECKEKCGFTDQEKEHAQQWLKEYEDSQKQPKDEVNPITRERQRTASSSIAMLLAGLPLYLYHWKMAKKQS